MRELDLLKERLAYLHNDYREQTQRVLLTRGSSTVEARMHATRADMCKWIYEEVLVLDKDMGQFIKQFLRRSEKE